MDVGCEGIVRGAVGVEGVALGRDKIESVRMCLAGTTRKTLGSSTGSSGYNFFFLGVGIVDARDNSVENVGGSVRV